MDKLNLYFIDKDYNNYMALFNKHIYHLKDQGFNRPFIGIILYINGFSYFAPLTSPKTKHFKMKNSIDFFKVLDYKRLIAVLNLNNMFPALPSYSTKIELNKVQDYNYRNLLIKELSFCRANEKNIKTNAFELYKGIVNQLFNNKLMKRCANFKLLEEKCLEYQSYLESAGEAAIAKEIDDMDIEKENKDELEMER